MQNNIPIENKHFSDLNPIICGSEVCEKGHSFGPACRKYYIIHYVVSGKGEFSVNESVYPIKSGEAFLIKPGQMTIYEADKKDPWHYIWIGFDGKLAKQLENMDSPVFKINSYVFLEMLKAADYSSTKEEYLAGKLFTLFTELFERNKNENYIEIVKNYIQASYMNKLRIYDIAKMINLDRFYLARLFKAKTGHSPKEYIIEIRLKEATVLLKKGYSVTQASNMVGYEDIFTFSKAYKKKYGYPPSRVYENTGNG